jgi:acylphosphatase
MDPSVSLHAIVTGLVQGVNFRYYTRERAQQLGLTGWVRNLRDGSVEVQAHGPRPALERLLDFLQRGPRSAVVEAVQAEWGEADSAFTTFEVRG